MFGCGFVMSGCRCLCVVSVFFFFKQKTAYEMRISDWSSDVCSSDLRWWFRHPTDDRSPGKAWPDLRRVFRLLADAGPWPVHDQPADTRRNERRHAETDRKSVV